VTAFLEILLLAFTIFSEALHESYEGKVAVASVIHNRVQKSNSDYYTVITAPKQFSCYNSHHIILNNLSKIEKRKSDAYISLVIAVAIVNKDIQPTVRSTHYTRKEIAKAWMSGYKVELVIGNHKFMEEK